MRIRTLFFALALTGAVSASAEVKFDKMFADSTLRIDYITGGNASESHILLRGQSKRQGWAGRRHNLGRLLFTGNGTVTVCDSLTGDTIYRHSFSTLFREWQSTPEANVTSKSFENTFLVPLPRRTAKITVELLNDRHERVASNSHFYSPQDILVKPAAAASPAPARYIHKGGSPEESIDVAILAEGYTPDRMDEFYAYARKAVDEMLSYEPYRSYRDKFNFIAVATPSADSILTVPREGKWTDTAFGSHFDTFYSDRYLTSPNVFAMHDALENVPYEHIIILANSPVYGGGGIYNSYMLATTRNKWFLPVIVHEFGHSFAGLADEYFYEGDVMEDSYPLDVEPWEPNITTLVDFPAKWQKMLKKDTPIPTVPADSAKYPVGVYEGGGYTFKGVFRPADRCRMRDNTWPTFCPVCTAAIEKLILFSTETKTR